MTREQKAAAAIGSVLCVSLLYTVAWSWKVGFLLLLAGTTACVVALRLTHPRARRRRMARTDDRRALEVEMSRRREEARRRTSERRHSAREEGQRSGVSEVLAAGHRSELSRARHAGGGGGQRHDVLAEVRARLTDYE